MSEIERDLMEAWRKMATLAQLSPREAAHRARRMRGVVLRRPMRSWCLALRASDTRISSWTAVILPPPGVMIGMDEDVDNLIHTHRPHIVILDGEIIRRFTKPVDIPLPGVTIAEARRMLGLTRNLVYAWIRAGTLKVSHYVRGRWGRGYGGKRRPIVYTPSPVDPARGAGRTPNPVWGTLWQSHWQLFPEPFRQVFLRVPRFQTIRGRRVFNGWEWSCGGRLDGPRAKIAGAACDGTDAVPLVGEHPTGTGCGRRCSIMYAPLPVPTLGQSGDEPLAFEMPPSSGLTGTWRPGQHHTPIGRGNRIFACGRCWQVRGCAMANRHGWHDFVSAVSGGLLHGSEVTRSPREAPIIRVRRPYRHAHRSSPKRDLVLQGICRGETYAQIAARTGMTYRAVSCQACALFKMYGVHSRSALRAQTGARGRRA